MWYLQLLVFLDKDFKKVLTILKGCYDLMHKAVNFNDITIISVERSDYKIHVWCIIAKMMS